MYLHARAGSVDEVVASVESVRARMVRTLREDAEGLPELLVGRGRVGPRGGEYLLNVEINRKLSSIVFK
jgi:hypothetical protein